METIKNSFDYKKRLPYRKLNTHNYGKMQWGDIISKKVFLHAFALQFSYEYIMKKHLHRNKNPLFKKDFNQLYTVAKYLR